MWGAAKFQGKEAEARGDWETAGVNAKPEEGVGVDAVDDDFTKSPIVDRDTFEAGGGTTGLLETEKLLRSTRALSIGSAGWSFKKKQMEKHEEEEEGCLWGEKQRWTEENGTLAEACGVACTWKSGNDVGKFVNMSTQNPKKVREQQKKGNKEQTAVSSVWPCWSAAEWGVVEVTALSFDVKGDQEAEGMLDEIGWTTLELKATSRGLEGAEGAAIAEPKRSIGAEDVEEAVTLWERDDDFHGDRSTTGRERSDEWFNWNKIRKKALLTGRVGCASCCATEDFFLCFFLTIAELSCWEDETVCDAEAAMSELSSLDKKKRRREKKKSIRIQQTEITRE